MKLLVLSDLHLGNGDTFGTFGWDPSRFISVLEDIRMSYEIDKLVINGDLYELYKYSHDDIVNNQQALVDYFKSVEAVYIRGNHDFFCEEGQDSLLIENSLGQTVYIEHGHNADLLNGTRIGCRIVRLFFRVLRHLVKIGWIRSAYFTYNDLIDEVDRVPRKYNSYRYLKYALRLLKTYDVVILGHTHKIEVHKTYYLNRKKRYFNCGSCTLGRFQAVMFDTETFDYDTIKISSADDPSYLSLERFKKHA
jgi:predicted phosphodiesterase